MTDLERIQMIESLELVIDYAEGKLVEIQTTGRADKDDEYERYKYALESIERAVNHYMNILFIFQRYGMF